ncbi:MAG: hypothetical protein J7484_14505 [Microbacterium sp.]|nr:hypothetical protein [Microbacterium sp.]
MAALTPDEQTPEHVVADDSTEQVETVVSETVTEVETAAPVDFPAVGSTGPVADAPPPAPTAYPAPPAPPTAPAATAPPVEPMYTSATPPQQVVYVHAPVPPRNAGNRGFGVLIAVLAAILYAILLAATAWISQYVLFGATGFEFLKTWDFYMPVAVFVIAFIIVAVIVNRAGWVAHVIGSLFVGAAVYFGSVGIVLLVNQLVFQQQDAPGLFFASAFYIVAAILAREVALWFGAIVSSRGKRVALKNAAARDEFQAKLAEFHAGTV